MGLLSKIKNKNAENKLDSNVIVTDIDKIHDVVIKLGSATLKDIATILKTDIKRVEELAKILGKSDKFMEESWATKS